VRATLITALANAQQSSSDAPRASARRRRPDARRESPFLEPQPMSRIVRGGYFFSTFVIVHVGFCRLIVSSASF